MFKVTNRNGSVFGNEPYICEFVCDTTSDVPTLPTSISEGTGGKTKYDNQLCSSGSIATVIDNGSDPKKYILDNQNTWCPYSVSEGSSIAITVDSSLSDVSKNPVENKVVTAAINNKADILHTHSANEVGADPMGSADSALASSKEYTDSEIAGLINGAPTTLDTLKEIADAMAENQTVVEALNTAIGSKADKTDIPTKVSQLENDSGYLSEHQDLSSYALKSLYGDTTINVGRKADSTVGDHSTAEGYQTTASGNRSHAEGASTTASGTASHAEGESTTSSGSSSHAEGLLTTASGTASHAEGSNYNSSNAALSDRTVTIDDTSYTITGPNAYGINSHAEGTQSFAYGYSSHAEGYQATSTAPCSHAEGQNTTASGQCSHAEGYITIASGNASHAEGYKTTASVNASHTEGYQTTATNVASHAEGASTTASGTASHAEGASTTASGTASHAEGSNYNSSNAALSDRTVTIDNTSYTITGPNAYGINSHAEGTQSFAYGYSSHAEGGNTTASGIASHAEGSNYGSNGSTLSDRKVTISDVDYTISGSTAYGRNSHAEGTQSFAYEYSSHAEGNRATASGMASHAEGYNTISSGSSSHAEGSSTTASGPQSHAEGGSSTASGNSSHAEGYQTTASDMASHAEGSYTTATNYASHAGGHYNAAMTDGGSVINTKGTAFVIGNGTSSSALSNAFSVQYDGIVKAKSTITASTTADYAEFFEWLDENPDEEDRVGYFVTLDGDKIRIATNEDDYILGVVSGEPFVLGNGDCDTWNGMFLRDEFRRTIYEPAPKMVEVLDSEGNPTGEFEEVEGEFEGTRPKLNPEYDHTQPYISRFDRKEWAPVGMLGVLAVRHDGTAQVNGYVTVNTDGIATACDKNAENSYRVIKANSDEVVEIIFR